MWTCSALYTVTRLKFLFHLAPPFSTNSDSGRVFFLQDFLQKLIRLLDSPSVVIRAKAFVVIHEVVKNNYDLLLNSCQSRYTNLFKVEIRHSLSTISKLMIFLVDTILHRTQIPINYTEHFFKRYQNLK